MKIKSQKPLFASSSVTDANFCGIKATSHASLTGNALFNQNLAILIQAKLPTSFLRKQGSSGATPIYLSTP